MTQLSIAQGLRRAKILKGELAQLTARAQTVSTYVERRKPEYDFHELLPQIVNTRENLVTLEAAIAKANAVTTIEFEGKEMTLAEAIRRLQENKGEQAWYSALHLRSGTEKEMDGYETDPQTGRQLAKYVEITYVPCMKEKERDQKLKELKSQFEALNDALEGANHRTSILWKETKPKEVTPTPSAPPPEA